MTDAEALALIVGRTGHRRYAELLDPGHPDYNPDYWPIVRTLAAGDDLPTKGCAQAESQVVVVGWRPSRFRAVQTCLYRDCHTGCRASICHARYGDSDGGERTSLTNCYECLGLNENSLAPIDISQ